MADTAADLEAKISAVDDAIEAVLLGQQYTLRTADDSQTVTRADLDKLLKYRSYLERRLSRMSTGGYPISGEARR